MATTLRKALEEHWNDLLQDGANPPMTGENIFDAIQGPFGDPEALEWEVANTAGGIFRVKADGYLESIPEYRVVESAEMEVEA